MLTASIENVPGRIHDMLEIAGPVILKNEEALDILFEHCEGQLGFGRVAVMQSLFGIQPIDVHPEGRNFLTWLGRQRQVSELLRKPR